MIKIYGSPMSSAGRCYIMLEELALEYERAPLSMQAKEHKSPEYLKLNPNGKVPCLIDGEFVIWESMAINFYLAEKYKSNLQGSSAEDRGKILQWSVWALQELQKPFVDLLIQMMFVPEPNRNQEVIAKANAALPPLLKILDQELDGKNYVVRNRFSLADLHLASVVGMAPPLQVPLTDYPRVAAWLTRCSERPAFKKVAEMGR